MPPERTVNRASLWWVSEQASWESRGMSQKQRLMTLYPQKSRLSKPDRWVSELACPQKGRLSKPDRWVSELACPQKGRLSKPDRWVSELAQPSRQEAVTRWMQKVGVPRPSCEEGGRWSVPCSGASCRRRTEGGTAAGDSFLPGYGAHQQLRDED